MIPNLEKFSHPAMGEDCWSLNTHCPSVDSQAVPEELEPLVGSGPREPGEDDWRLYPVETLNFQSLGFGYNCPGPQGNQDERRRNDSLNLP